VILVVVAVMAPGCVTALKATGPAQADRLKQVYPELESGRYLMIADFEDPSQLGMFEAVNASGRASLEPHPARGRAETGGGALLFTAGSPSDAVVVSNRQESKWYLKRDWRAYDVLLMSVFSPVAGLDAGVSAAGGAAGERTAATVRLPLVSGWNLLRLDLAEMGEQVPIDDVQELRLGIAGQVKPVTVTLDDILLTGSREDLLGDPGDTSGAAYVQRVGRRWNVGAGGRFEISFMNGQVRRWYNLATDPHKIRNLLEGVSLGPMPVTVNDAGEFASVIEPGAGVSVQQKLVEMNPVRVVVDVVWRVESDAAARENAARGTIFRWRYTIYPTGQIFARVDAVAPESGNWQAPTAVVVALADLRPDLDAVVLDEQRSGSNVVYARAVHQPTRSLLALIPNVDASAADLQLGKDASRQVSFVLRDRAATGSVRSWSLQMRVGEAAASETPSFNDDTIAGWAADYRTDAPVDVLIGAPAAAGRGANGYDAADGTFVISPKDGKVRLRLDGSKRPIVSPAFRIDGSAGLDAWVYVNHLVHKKVARDAGGDVLFQIPGTLTKPAIVEVILRERTTS